jgi:hypothetical protein
LVVTTAPEKIYLQVTDDTFYRDETFPADYGDDITWCADSVVDCEVEYIRADLATPAQTVDIEAVREVIAHLNEYCKFSMGHISDKLSQAIGDKT